MLAWLAGAEPARTRVEALVPSQPVMSWINVAEVYYRFERDRGRLRAEEVAAGLRRGMRLDLTTDERVLQAARIKARHPMSLADCFAVATATAHGLPLLTGDPEIIDAPGLGCEVEDLRGP